MVAIPFFKLLGDNVGRFKSQLTSELPFTDFDQTFLLFWKDYGFETGRLCEAVGRPREKGWFRRVRWYLMLYGACGVRPSVTFMDLLVHRDALYSSHPVLLQLRCVEALEWNTPEELSKCRHCAHKRLLMRHKYFVK